MISLYVYIWFLYVAIWLLYILKWFLYIYIYVYVYIYIFFLLAKYFPSTVGQGAKNCACNLNMVAEPDKWAHGAKLIWSAKTGPGPWSLSRKANKGEVAHINFLSNRFFYCFLIDVCSILGPQIDPQLINQNVWKRSKMINNYCFEVINAFLWTVFVRLSRLWDRKCRPMNEMY